MKVVLAKTAGFCFGVKRAVDRVFDLTKEEKPLYTLGPIIHNEEVVKDLEKRGVTVLKDAEAALDIPEDANLVLRTHGISKSERGILEKVPNCMIDATCPYVSRIHKIVQKEGEKGRSILIAGNPKHPEILGIIGWCISPVFVIESAEDLDKVTGIGTGAFTLVAQTTFHHKKFKDIVEKIKEKGYDVDVVNTICSATMERQTEAMELAKTSDCMLVVGGTHSSNTRKLVEICEAYCENTHFVQTAADIDRAWFQGVESIGITAGASTPENIIEEVLFACRTT